MRVTILALLLVASAAGCLNNDDAPSGDASNETANDNETGEMGEPEAIVVTVGRAPGVGVPPTTYTLSPATLELSVGKTYSLTLQNDDPLGGHDLVIEGLDVAIDTVGVSSTSEPVEFTPMEAGTYRMYCSIGKGNPTGHDEQGMHGEVVVS